MPFSFFLKNGKIGLRKMIISFIKVLFPIPILGGHFLSFCNQHFRLSGAQKSLRKSSHLAKSIKNQKEVAVDPSSRLHVD